MTPRQRELLAYLAAYEIKHGCQPSFREMADGIGLSSKSNAHGLMRQLADQGYVAQIAKGVERACNWRVTDAGHAALAAGGRQGHGVVDLQAVGTVRLLDELRRRGCGPSIFDDVPPARAS